MQVTKAITQRIHSLRKPPQPQKLVQLRYYLVDYENVHDGGLKGLTGLTDTDIVCIFYSSHANTLCFSSYHALQQTKAAVFDQNVYTKTPDALDFQLDTYLGALIERYKDLPVQFYIVSNDRGYENIVAYWKRTNVPISLIPNIANQPGHPKPTANLAANNRTKTANIEESIRILIPDKETATRTIQIVKAYKSKQQIHNALTQAWPKNTGKKGHEIYKKIKPLL